VSTEVHERIMAMADERGWSVDTVLRHLTDDTTVRIPMMPGQLTRWQTAAAETGMPLPVWAVTHVESAIVYGGNRSTLAGIWTSLEHVKEHFGIHAR
jgi:hypothetical protein